MKTLQKFIVIALAGNLFMTGCATSSKHSTYEYRIIQGVPRQEEFQKRLNAAAAEGYAIHSSTFVPGDERTQHQMILILKRRTP